MFLSSEICYTLNYLSETTPVQLHFLNDLLWSRSRSQKQEIGSECVIFLIFKIICSQLFVIVLLYLVFINVITMSFKYKYIDSTKYLQSQGQGHLNSKSLGP